MLRDFKIRFYNKTIFHIYNYSIENINAHLWVILQIPKMKIELIYYLFVQLVTFQKVCPLNPKWTPLILQCTQLLPLFTVRNVGLGMVPWGLHRSGWNGITPMKRQGLKPGKTRARVIGSLAILVFIVHVYTLCKWSSRMFLKIM